MFFSRRSAGFLAALIAFLAAGRSIAEPLHLGYPRELYLEQGPGNFTFDFLRAAELIIADSGLEVEWMPVPIARVTYLIERHDYLFCLAGAAITKEREEQGRFTFPYLYDDMVAVVARAERRQQLDRLHSFAELAAGTNSGFFAFRPTTYGPTFSETLNKLGPRVTYDVTSIEQMLDMIAARRGDFAILPKTYALNFLATRRDAEEFTVASYPDMRRGLDAAFWCNKAVPPEAVAALNAAITRQASTIRSRFPHLTRPSPAE